MVRRWGLTAVTIAIAIASALLLSGCIMITESGGGSSSTGGTASNAPQTKVKATGPSLVSQSQTSGNWRVTVNEVQLQNQLADGESAKSGNKLMIVDVSFYNVGSTNYLVIRPGQATLTDSRNKVVPVFPTKLGAFNAQSVNSVGARYGANTAYVYEIPAGSSGYIFSFKPDPSGETVLRWRVP